MNTTPSIYIPRIMIEAPLPLCKPLRKLEKTIGGKHVAITSASPNNVLPYGKMSRIISLYATSCILQNTMEWNPGSRTLKFGKQFARFIKYLHVSRSKLFYRNYREQLSSWALTNYTVTESSETTQFHTVQSIDYPMLTSNINRVDGTLTLTQEFVDLIIKDNPACMPSDMSKIMTLCGYSLDMALLVAYVIAHGNTPAFFSWDDLRDMLTDGEVSVANYKHSLSQHLDIVNSCWAEPRVAITPEYLAIN